MVLAGVVGAVGSGKTTLLAELAQWVRESGKTVDGFLSIPHDRSIAGRGAEQYDLKWIASGVRMPFSRRDDSLQPPYRLDQAALEHAAAWARGLAQRPPLSVLLIDEFGPFEAEGLGHMSYWSSLRDASPELLILAVRANLVETIAGRLGMPFDVSVEAGASDSLGRLKSLVLHQSDWVRIGRFGAAAGGFEATVGSVLHGAQVPMRGLFLSTVQSLFMMYSGDRLAERSRVVWVPLIAAGLKALSPAGNRLRPMLAISMQGFLFSLFVTLLGWNALGIFSAGWFVGAWAASQGIVLQYLFIGDSLFQAVDTVIQWLAEHLRLDLPGIAVVFLLWIVLWGMVSASVTLFFWLRRHRLPARLGLMLSRGADGIVLSNERPGLLKAVRRGLRDLLRPVFWVPVAVVVGIVLASGSGWEQGVWIVGRAVVVGWVLFSVARLFDPRKLVAWLERKGHWGPALAFRSAFRLHTREEKRD